MLNKSNPTETFQAIELWQPGGSDKIIDVYRIDLETQIEEFIVHET